MRMNNINNFRKVFGFGLKLLTFEPRYQLKSYNFQEIPRQYNFKWQPWEKKILFKKSRKLVPEVMKVHDDVLTIPGIDNASLAINLYIEYSQKKVPLTPENTCALIYTFAKYYIKDDKILKSLQNQAYTHKGLYKPRSVFGGLVGSLFFRMNKLMDFFMEEYQAGKQQLTFEECVQLLQALNKNKSLEYSIKKSIWNQNFKPTFDDGLKTFKRLKTNLIIQIYNALQQIKEQDSQTWELLIQFMKDKKKWERIPIIEKLYELSGTYKTAKTMFDEYFEQLSQQYEIVSRYNLTEMRYYTPLELIKYAQQNPSDYSPKIRTLIPEQYDAAEWNRNYEQYLLKGSITIEQQVLRDKSKSLGYVIKQRFQSLKADNQDLSSISQKQFEEMFGSYSQVTQTIRIQNKKIQLKQQEEQIGKQREQQDQLAQQAMQNAGRKEKKGAEGGKLGAEDKKKQKGKDKNKSGGQSKSDGESKKKDENTKVKKETTKRQDQ